MCLWKLLFNNFNIEFKIVENALNIKNVIYTNLKFHFKFFILIQIVLKLFNLSFEKYLIVSFLKIFTLMTYNFDFLEKTIHFASNVIFKIINFLRIIFHSFLYESNRILK